MKKKLKQGRKYIYIFLFTVNKRISNELPGNLENRKLAPRVTT